MNIESYVKAQVARFAIEEGARHGGVNNMLAVAHVLRNRVFAGWGDWIEVVHRAHERCGTIYAPEMPNIRTTGARMLLGRIDEIYSRTDLIDLTGGALFYFDTGHPVQPWFKRDILDRPEDHARCCHIGPVWFYK